MATASAEAVVAEAATPVPALDFNSTRITELSMQWVKPEADQSLMAYFQQVFPVAEKYGVRALGRLVPEEAIVGELQPHVIGLVEWPKLESFDNFMADDDYRRLYPQRDAALDRLIVTHLQAVDDASVSFDPDKAYELSGLWIRPDGGREKLDDYYAKLSSLLSEFGARTVLKFAGVRSAWGDFLPNEVRITEWQDKETYDRFRDDARVEQLASLRDSALSKLTITRCSAQAMGH